MTDTGPISVDELRHLAEAVIELSRASAPWAVTLTWEPGPGIGLVATDPRAIEVLRSLGFSGQAAQ